MKIKVYPERIPPDRRGATINVIDKVVLERALSMSEDYHAIGHGVWVDESSGKTLALDFDRGIDAIYRGERLGAFGLWSLGAEFAKYGKLLSLSAPDRDLYAVHNTVRVHRLLYAHAMKRYGSSFVALSPSNALQVMSAALKELQG